MSARQFRLAGVLRVRRLQEDLARAEVARATAEVARAAAEAAARHERAAARRPPDRASAGAYLASLLHGLTMASDAATASGAVTELEAVVDERRAEWQAAATKVKPLERLEDNHRAALRAADEKAAQAVSDEIAGARHDAKARRARHQAQQKLQQTQHQRGAA